MTIKSITNRIFILVTFISGFGRVDSLKISVNFSNIIIIFMEMVLSLGRSMQSFSVESYSYFATHYYSCLVEHLNGTTIAVWQFSQSTESMTTQLNINSIFLHIVRM